MKKEFAYYDRLGKYWEIPKQELTDREKELCLLLDETDKQLRGMTKESVELEEQLKMTEEQLKKKDILINDFIEQIDDLEQEEKEDKRHINYLKDKIKVLDKYKEILETDIDVLKEENRHLDFMVEKYMDYFLNKTKNKTKNK